MSPARDAATGIPARTVPAVPARISLEAHADRIGRAEDLQLESLERDIELRTMFGKVLLGIAIVVNLATITLVAATGLGFTRLSDRLLIALISSTVAELAGLVLVVAKYLFPAPPVPREGPRSTSRDRRGSRAGSG